MEKKEIHYGGDGFAYAEEVGKFSVKYEGDKEVHFTSLSQARKFYDSLKVDKAIWDNTTIPELLDCIVYE